ncbi:MAG: hypothetical protein Kow00121_02330 [Elainellaceae cyanobacterium]
MNKQRWLWAGAIVILTLMVLSLFAAPNTAGLRQGSTYSRSPSGYGAWFAYMQDQGIEVQRWQKPLETLTQPSSPDTVPIANWQGIETSTASPLTLLQVANGQGWLNAPDRTWIEQGNVLIQLGVGLGMANLGVSALVTDAPFTAMIGSTVGEVKVDTSRRFVASTVTQPSGSLLEQEQALLADRYGVVVLEQTIGQGRVIAAITPHLAANAYQDQPGNFEFLAQLVTEPGYPVWVDEYLHGYKDKAVIAEETADNLLNYLSKTPILLVAVQAIVILGILIWGLNQRLGPPVSLTIPQTDNSQAYMQALSAVLQKANGSEFVVKAIGRAEQLHVQRSLGLGADLLDPAIVVAAWQERTGQPSHDLEHLLAFTTQPRRLSDQELLIWLKKVQVIRQQLAEWA